MATQKQIIFFKKGFCCAKVIKHKRVNKNYSVGYMYLKMVELKITTHPT